MNKKSFAGSFIVMVCIVSVVLMSRAVPAIGQDKYPSKPITFSIGFAAGGGTDIVARSFGKALEKILKQKVVVLNQPGAATQIHMNYLKKAPPDGYTIGMTGSTFIINSHLREVPINFFEDYTHLVQIIEFIGGLCVNIDSPWKTMKELIEYAQKNPGKLKYGTTEAGSPGMLIMESLAVYNKFKWVHVPFTGNALAAAALLGNHVDVMFGTPPDWGPFVKSGKFRLLGVPTEKRLKNFLDAPTFKEQRIKYYEHAPIAALTGIAAPKGLPANVRAILIPALREAWKDPEFQTILDQQSTLAEYREGEEWVLHLKAFDKEAVQIMRDLGWKMVQ